MNKSPAVFCGFFGGFRETRTGKIGRFLVVFEKGCAAARYQNQVFWWFLRAFPDTRRKSAFLKNALLNFALYLQGKICIRVFFAHFCAKNAQNPPEGRPVFKNGLPSDLFKARASALKVTPRSQVPQAATPPAYSRRLLAPAVAKKQAKSMILHLFWKACIYIPPFPANWKQSSKIGEWPGVFLKKWCKV